MGTKNANVLLSSTKQKGYSRRYSRQSAKVFTPIDFLYSGNTSEVNHLIKRSGANSTALNFDLNLRNYVNQTNYRAEEPWIWPQPKKIDPVGLDKPVFGSAIDLRKQSHTTKKAATRLS